MTKQSWVTGIALAVALAFSGCGKQDATTTPGGEVAAIDTTSVEKQFQTAEPGVRADFDQAVTAVKSGNYSEALDKLKSLASNAKLTPQQQQAIKDLMAKVQEAVTSGATSG